jgi:hypothetical protein
MHEWQSTDKNSKCAWCGADGYVVGKSWFDEPTGRTDEGKELGV